MKVAIPQRFRFCFLLFFWLWNGYLLACEPHDRAAPCDRFMAEAPRPDEMLQDERTLEINAETARSKTRGLNDGGLVLPKVKGLWARLSGKQSAV